MSKEQLKKLKNKIFGGKGGEKKQSELTAIIELARGLNCLPDILGRDYEIRDPKGKLVYTLRQKPMAIKQLNTLLKEFELIQKRDNEKEAAKWGGNKGKISKLGRKKR